MLIFLSEAVPLVSDKVNFGQKIFFHLWKQDLVPK